MLVCTENMFESWFRTLTSHAFSHVVLCARCACICSWAAVSGSAGAHDYKDAELALPSASKLNLAKVYVRLAWGLSRSALRSSAFVRACLGDFRGAWTRMNTAPHVKLMMGCFAVGSRATTHASPCPGRLDERRRTSAPSMPLKDWPALDQTMHNHQA